MSQSSRTWPPRLIFNTDGNWMTKYLPERRPEKISAQLDELVGAGIEALSVLVGIDDAPSWRGSAHADMWGDHVEVWDPDPDVDGRGKPIPKKTAGGADLSHLEYLHKCLEALIEDGRALMQIYIDACRQHEIAPYASFRMNDAHTSDEARQWQVRGRQKRARPDLLIGPLMTEGTHGWQWNFSWQWDYAQEEVRRRFLGLIDEVLERFDFDGVELDWMRQPPFFKSGQAFAQVDVLSEFMRQALALVRRHAAKKKKAIRLITRIPPSLDEATELGLDVRAWLKEGLADLFVLSSASLCTPAVDIAAAVKSAAASGSHVFSGFDGANHLSSPHEGYERGQPCVLRAVAHNGYLQGAAGVHLFNYDIPHHRASPAESDGYNADHLQLLGDLKNPQILAERDRGYSVADSHLGGNPGYTKGDHRPQVPRQLPILKRGTGGRGYAMDMRIEDDLEAGLAQGRIEKTQLRLRLTEHEECIDRIICRINGRDVAIAGSPTIQNQWGNTWLLIDDPPVRRGDNQILVGLDGLETPAPWPTLHQCEVLVFCR